MRQGSLILGAWSPRLKTHYVKMTSECRGAIGRERFENRDEKPSAAARVCRRLGLGGMGGCLATCPTSPKRCRSLNAVRRYSTKVQYEVAWPRFEVIAGRFSLALVEFGRDP
jgi:hypothetical protein